MPPEFDLYSKINDILSDIDDIKHRLSQLESSKDQLQNEEESFPGIPPEKTTAIRLILNNKTLGWRAALRKVLVVVFGINVLANSCAMGKRNATYSKLDSALLRSIKGIYNYYVHHAIYCDIFSD